MYKFSAKNFNECDYSEQIFTEMNGFVFWRERLATYDTMFHLFVIIVFKWPPNVTILEADH